MTGQLIHPRGIAQARQLVYSPADLTIAAGTLRMYNDTGYPWEILSVRATLAVAASAGDTTADVNKNGASIFTAGAQPTIPAGSLTVKQSTIATTTVNDGEYLTVDVDAAGTSAVGLIVTIAIR